MKYFNSILFIVFFKLGWGQINLVPNPSFESYSACPVFFSELFKCNFWINPNVNTPDYFHECNTQPPNISPDVPNNMLGNQNAKTGFAYSGIYLFENVSNRREYLGILLSDTLISGKKYCVGAYLSSADLMIYTTDDFGFLFSDTLIFQNDLLYLPFTPQVTNLTGNFLNDKVNWVEISGEFIAQGGEQYLYIGNFNPDSATDTVNLNDGSSWYGAYVYIDDVSVYLCEESDSIFISNVFTPNNDEINDLFLLENLPQGYEVIIYNRWGEIMQQFSHLGTETKNTWYWDGYTMAGLSCPEGVYYYVITLPDKDSRTGMLHLMK